MLSVPAPGWSTESGSTFPCGITEVATMKILKEIRGVSLGSFVTRGERLAIWINTYNALVADGIAALGLRRSVWELPNFFQRVGCRVGGLTFTADDIEHGVLRGNR